MSLVSDRACGGMAGAPEGAKAEGFELLFGHTITLLSKAQFSVAAKEGFSDLATVPINTRAAPGSERHQSEQAESSGILGHNFKE